MRILVAGLLALVGCGGGGGFECTLSTVQDVFNLHSEERAGGTCGELPDTQAYVEDLFAGPAGWVCETVSDERTSDDCEIQGVVDCDIPDGRTVRTIFTVTQVGPDGGTGVTTYTFRDAAGLQLCASTYDMTFARQ